jgi:hypothetical protein
MGVEASILFAGSAIWKIASTDSRIVRKRLALRRFPVLLKNGGAFSIIAHVCTA